MRLDHLHIFADIFFQKLLRREEIEVEVLLNEKEVLRMTEAPQQGRLGRMRALTSRQASRFGPLSSFTFLWSFTRARSWL
jgi:hypothetical protein